MEPAEQTSRFKASYDSLVQNINNRMPAFPVLGFACWFAWNLIAFSGTIWTNNGTGVEYISIFIIAHLFSSTAVHICVSLNSEKLAPRIMGNAWLIVGSVLATVGTAFMFIADGNIPHVYNPGLVFILGSASAGVGTSFVFIRSASFLGTENPRKSFAHIFMSALFAIAVYFVLLGYKDSFGPVLFALLPAFGALCLSVRRPTPLAMTTLKTTYKTQRQFKFFLGAVFIYSFAQETIKTSLLVSKTSAESLFCMQVVMAGLLFLSIALVFGELFLASGSIHFARIYYPLALLFVVPQMLLPIFESGSLIPAAAIDFAGYAFDLLLWCMCAYLSFQTKGNVFKYTCMSTAALSFGLASGSGVGMALYAAQIGSASFTVVNYSMAFVTVLATMFVFPEKKLVEIFAPAVIDEDEPKEQKDSMEYWLEAVERVAQKGALSQREKEVLSLISQGMTAQAAADELVISVYTVRSHIRKIHSKLNVSSQRELVDMIREHMDSL